MANYFTKETENYIIEFKQTHDNELYEKEIRPAFQKLIENIINIFKFYEIDRTHLDELKNDCEGYLYSIIHKFKEERGKAFSFFSIVCKNYLIQKSRKERRITNMSIMIDNFNNVNEEPEEIIVEIDDINLNPDIQSGNVLSERIQYIIKKLKLYVNNNIQDKQQNHIANTLVGIIESCNYLEFQNKKYVYALVRNICNCETADIAEIMKLIIPEYYKANNEYNNL